MKPRFCEPCRLSGIEYGSPAELNSHAATLWTAGYPYMAYGAIFNNFADATFTIATAGSEFWNGDSTAVFNNAGAISHPNATSTTFYYILNNSGSLSIANGTFSHGNPELFRPIVDMLLYQDNFLHLADYPSFIRCQDEVDRVYRDTERWTRMSILNSARCGYFSSDRSIQQYCDDIWKPKHS